MGKRQRIILDRRAFLQFSGASLAACGLGLALNQPARAEIADPADESPDSFTIDDLIESTNDPEIESFAKIGMLPFAIAGVFAANFSRIPNLSTIMADFVKDPSVVSKSIWARLPDTVFQAGPNRFVVDWTYRQIWEQLPPERRAYYKNAGGLPTRTTQEAFRVFKTIPLRLVMGGEEELHKFHKNKHWSHIIPKSQGGSNLASNGIFWDARKNLELGSNPMTVEDIEDAQRAINKESKEVDLGHQARSAKKLANDQLASIGKGLKSPVFRRNLLIAARPILPVAVAALAVEVTIVALEEGLRYHKGEIKLSDLFTSVSARIGKNAVTAVVVLGVVFGLMMVVPALGALFTSLAPVLVIMTFLLYGYRFYALSKEWLQRFEFGPVIAAWNETKQIPKQAWAQAASSFESFQNATREASERALRSAGDASERAWQDIGVLSDSAWQGIGAAPRSVIQGTQGITARTWQGVEFFPNGALESIGDFSAGAWQGAGSASQNAVQVTTETTSGAWEWVTVTSDGIAVDVTGVPEHVLDWLRDTFLPWLGDRVSPAVFWK